MEEQKCARGVHWGALVQEGGGRPQVPRERARAGQRIHTDSQVNKMVIRWTSSQRATRVLGRPAHTMRGHRSAVLSAWVDGPFAAFQALSGLCLDWPGP